MRRSPRTTLAVAASAVIITVLTSGTASADLREDFEALATAIEATGQSETAAQLRAAVHALSDEQLDMIYADADLAGITGGFTRTAEALNTIDGSTPERRTYSTTGFPDAVGYPSPGLCPFSPDRSDADAFIIAVDAIQAARVLLEAAKVLWSGLSRACDQVAVVCPAPGGGNTSLACIPADIVLFAAELVVGAAQATVDHLAACDAAVDAAEIEGSYERLGHFHDDWTCKFPGDTTIDRSGHGCNGIDDDCSGVIDDCGEDVFGPVVFIDQSVTKCCYDDAADAAAAVALGVKAWDDCGNITVGAPVVNGTECDVTVDVTATDDCGNSTTASTSVRIDGDGPSITIDPAVNAPGVCYSSIDEAEQAVLAAATITDNCDSLDDLDIKVHSSVTECMLRVRLDVTDTCGNESTAAVTVRVDTHLPAVDIEELLLGFRGEVLAFQTPVCYDTVAEAEAAVLAVTEFSDNCTAEETLTTSVSSAGNPCSLAVTPKAVDECLNENTDTVTVRVDSEAPVIACSATVLPNDDDDVRLLIAFSVTDNCGLSSVTSVIETPCRDIPVVDGQIVELECEDDDCELDFENGILDIEATTAALVVTAEDECGNIATCTVELCALVAEDD